MSSRPIIRPDREAQPQAGDYHAVQLWALSFADLAAEEARCRALLAPDERERAARLRTERLRRDFVLARGTLRTILGGYLGLDPASLHFAYGPQGKPTLPKWPAVQFNLAHAGGRVVYAIAQSRAVGVDLEPIDPSIDTLALGKHVLTPGEQTTLTAAPPDERPYRFLRLWTGKEAIVKANGGGLSIDPRQIDLHTATSVSHDWQTVTTPDRGSYQLAYVALWPDYVACLALAGAGSPNRLGITTHCSPDGCNNVRLSTL